MVVSLRTWFRNMLIRNKIICVYIPLIIIPLFVVGYCANRMYTQEIIEKTIKNLLDDSTLIITRIDSILKNSENCVNALLLDINKIDRPNGEDAPADNSQSELNEYELLKRSQIQTKLSFATATFNEVESAMFISSDAQLYTSSDNLKKGYEKAFHSDLLKNVEDAEGIQFMWFPMQKRDFLTTDKDIPYLTLGRKIVNINTGEKVGSVILNIKEDKLSDVYRNIGQAERRNYYIVDQNGLVVSSSNKMDILKPVGDPDLLKKILSNDSFAQIMSVNGNRILVTATPFQRMGWKLVNETPIDELTTETDKITLLIIALSLISLFFALLGAGILTNGIVKPLIKLASTMKKIRQGNFEVRCKVESEDEVGLLASVFNEMVRRLNELVTRIKYEQKKKRELELALIQAQIKPHFLYNTLDLIYVMCRAGEYKECESATLALADFYRTALSSGKENISVGKEIENLKNYLFIQKCRYVDVFDYEIDIPNEILDYEILKLTLQPLVENSIYHGLKEKGSSGKITINSSVEDDKIWIYVVDDGIGIPKEKINKLLEQHTEQNLENLSFGLNSVNERLRLYFGDDYGITISSEYGEWTKVAVSLPLIKKGVHYVE